MHVLIRYHLGIVAMYTNDSARIDDDVFTWSSCERLYAFLDGFPTENKGAAS